MEVTDRQSWRVKNMKFDSQEEVLVANLCSWWQELHELLQGIYDHAKPGVMSESRHK